MKFYRPIFEVVFKDRSDLKYWLGAYEDTFMTVDEMWLHNNNPEFKQQ